MSVHILRLVPDDDLQGPHFADKDTLNWLEQMTMKAFTKLEALGQCIPSPRHILPVSQYGSLIQIATNI